MKQTTVANCSSISSKKQQRLEKRKRKLLALTAVMMLNERSRVKGNSATAGLQQILKRNGSAFDIAADEEPQSKKTRATAAEVEALVEEEAKVKEKEEEETETNEGEPEGDQLSTDDYRTLKSYVNQQKNMRNRLRLRLKEVGEDALLKTDPEQRVPLLLDDIQALLMHALLRSDSPATPERWASLEKSTKLSQIAVVVVEGFVSEDFVEHRKEMKNCQQLFEHVLQVVCPSQGLVEELTCVPLSDTYKDILVAEYGSLETAMLACKDHLLIRKSIFNNIIAETPEEDESKYSELDLPDGDKFPRTQLLLSPIQMINEDYPLPLTGSMKQRYEGYVTINDQYMPVTPRSPMYALDCEMCVTSIRKSELTRVSIVDEQGNEIYETLVKPTNKIIDYVTQFSGITEEMMRDVTKTLSDVHSELRNLLPPDAIIIGQSLNFDLNAMKIMHPYVIDTSVLFNLTGTPRHKTKLKILTKMFLDKDIQCSTEGHDSKEDCTSCLELVKMKLSKNIYFGDQYLQDRRNYHRNVNRLGIAKPSEIAKLDDGPSKAKTEITSTLFAHAKKKNKRSAIVTNSDSLDQTYRGYFGSAIKAASMKGKAKKCLAFEKVNTVEEIFTQAEEQCLNYEFNVYSAKLDAAELADTEGKVAKLREIDQYVNRLYKALAVNSLLVVILAGGEVNLTSRMAVAMIQTKKY